MTKIGVPNKFYCKYRTVIFSVPTFILPLIIYLLTLERKLVGGDTSWYALYLPKMEVMVPTGYPTFSIIGKLFTLLPIADTAYRLNLVSAVFGSLTILFLFLTINKLTKNAPVSFAGAMIFAFLYSYWTVANRLEFDTLNSFMLALILYSAFLYTEDNKRKYLYFFFASLGFSLTNHPIAFFIMPAFVLYIILLNPGVFKNIKAILLSILFFLLPLSLYLWLPVRSLQGYGPVTTPRAFFYYITGRNITGKVHGGSFSGKNLETFLKVVKDFFLAIYNNFGILLLVIAIAGLVYLFVKNRKFTVCSLLAIILNVIIICLYLGYSPENYALNAMMFTCIYISFGFLLLFDRIAAFFKSRSTGNTTASTTDLPENSHGREQKKQHFKYIAFSALFLIIFMFPSYLIAVNYQRADQSKPLEVYKYWNKILDYAENNSVIYVSSSSENIGEFINTYERPEKNITIISNRDSSYNVDEVRENIAEDRKIYFVGIEEELIAAFNVKKIIGYTWDRMNEYIVFYDYAGEKMKIDVVPEISKKAFVFGEKFELKYRMINNNKSDIEITSLELKLPENVKFLGTDPAGTIKLEPSISQGKYMWVRTFAVGAGSEINIVVVLQAASPGEGKIDFRITSQNYYFDSEKIKISITD
jgi:hypothetical protein